MTSTDQAVGAKAAAIGAGETLREAGHRMRELGVTSLHVCGADGKPLGMISRDMLVRRIAAGGDPKTVTAGEVALAGSPGRPSGSRGESRPGPASPQAESGPPGDAGPREDTGPRDDAA